MYFMYTYEWRGGEEGEEIYKNIYLYIFFKKRRRRIRKKGLCRRSVGGI